MGLTGLGITYYYHADYNNPYYMFYQLDQLRLEFFHFSLLKSIFTPFMVYFSFYINLLHNRTFFTKKFLYPPHPGTPTLVFFVLYSILCNYFVNIFKINLVSLSMTFNFLLISLIYYTPHFF